MSLNGTLQPGPVGLNVTNLDRSLEFYRRVFGLEVHSEGHDPGCGFAYLTLQGRVVVTLWEKSRGNFPPALPGLHHMSFQADSVERIHCIENVLRRLAVEYRYSRAVSHAEDPAQGGIFFTDPDGIRLEVHASPSQDAPPPSAAWAEST
ncbi:VOC family protein [Streptomyces sp. 8N616]|uniref:VOC family protein n=1 Tax=Streptomyces sp. 8N616 TaxID=3457414 RepID=UPI003FD26F94